MQTKTLLLMGMGTKLAHNVLAIRIASTHTHTQKCCANGSYEMCHWEDIPSFLASIHMQSLHLTIDVYLRGGWCKASCNSHNENISALPVNSSTPFT